MINSKEIDKYIHELLIKPYNVKLEATDLEKVKKIVLSKLNIKNELVEYDYNDLSQLVNIEKCSLEFLDINDELVRNLNLLNFLKSLELNSCNIKTNTQINNAIETLILKDMDKSAFSMFNCTSIDTIELIDFQKVDLLDMMSYICVKNLYIYNSNIINFEQILNMGNIKVLKLDGSKIDNEEVLDKISKEIVVQRKEEYLLCD